MLSYLIQKVCVEGFLSFAESPVAQGAAFQLSKASFDALQGSSIFWEEVCAQRLRKSQ